MCTLVLVEHPLTAPCLRVRNLLLLGRPAGHLLLRLHHLLPELHIYLADDVRLCETGERVGAGRVMRARSEGGGLGKERAIVRAAVCRAAGGALGGNAADELGAR